MGPSCRSRGDNDFFFGLEWSGLQQSSAFNPKPETLIAKSENRNFHLKIRNLRPETRDLRSRHANLTTHSVDYEIFETPEFWGQRDQICNTQGPKVDYLKASCLLIKGPWSTVWMVVFGSYLRVQITVVRWGLLENVYT